MSSKKEQTPSKHHPSRRRTLSDCTELSSPKLSKSEEPRTTNPTTTQANKRKALISSSQENLKTAKQILEQIRHFKQESRKQSSVESERLKRRNSDSSTVDEVQVNVIKKTVVADIHELKSSHKEATGGSKNNGRQSQELIVEKEEPQTQSIDLKTSKSEATQTAPKNIPGILRISENPQALQNYKLIAASKLVRQSSDKSGAQYNRTETLPSTSSNFLAPGEYLNPLYQPFDYRPDHSPPPPAPSDPPQQNRPTTNIYLNPFYESEHSRLIESTSRREPCIADFLQYRTDTRLREAGRFASTNVGEFRSFRTDSFISPEFQQHRNIETFTYSAERFELPRVNPTIESPQSHIWRTSERADIAYPTGISYADTPPRRSAQQRPRHLGEEYRNIRIPNPTENGRCGEDQFVDVERQEPLRLRYRSPRIFLNLSPDFDEDLEGVELHQLPQKYFRRPVEQRFRERCPPPVQLFEPHHRDRLNPTPSPRHRRDPRSPTTPSRYPFATSSSGRSQYDFLGLMGRMNPLEDHERKIIIEFCHLLEKSKQLFNGLRELPQYGHKQWHSYFGRTFDVYTKLWKFQQQHRAILDSKYGLKRWQIGEIASKIGQLYYHFYLRTSETAYLNEAYSFYFAIRGRSYYTQACKEDKCELMVKKLRYYARFIVACLLLKKGKLVKDLIKELDKQIIEYGNAYEPDDQNEWRIVADEVRAFIKAEPVVSVIHPDDYAVILSHRLSAQSTPPVERSPVMNLSLQEVLIVGSNSTQVKFSELTMDMFRMMQTLEREPTGDVQHMYDESPRQRYISTPSAVNNKGYSLDCSSNRGESPHKYLLFKPSPNQIFVYLASACDDLPPNGVVLLYISAEGLIVPPLKHTEDAGGYDIGGLITTSRTDIVFRETTKDGKPVQPKHKEIQVLHPGDLYPFTRRPMFLIVDSDNSFIFHDLPRFFGQPLIILMSPLEQPSSLHPTSGDKRAEGSLFTLFLHCPLSAFCYCCEIKTMPLSHWERAQNYIDTYLAEASQIITRSRIDGMYLAYMGDDFMRLLILRFIFCETFLRMHRLFRGRTQRTRASPPLPEDLYEHPALTHIVIDLASHLQVRGHFHDPSAVAQAQPPNRE